MDTFFFDKWFNNSMISYPKIATFLAPIALLLIGQVKGKTQASSEWYRSDQTLIPSALSGGFLAPQFSSFDLNQDGVHELISFDRFSGVIQIWNPDAENEVDFTVDLSTRVEWPVVESWLLIKDYNQDGVPDMFTQGLHGIAVYQGYREQDILRFHKMEGDSFLDDSLLFQSQSGNKTNIYHTASDIPIIEDIDEDGDLDILSFELSGSYLYFYENQWDRTGKELDFVLSHKCWGYFVENQLSEQINLSNTSLVCPPPFSVRHSGSASCLIDVDLDSVPDLLLGDRGAKSIKVLFNSGRANTGFIESVRPVFPEAGSPAFLHYFPAAYKVDINQDSIEDVLIAVNDYPLTDFEGLWAYKGTQDQDHPFQLESDHWLSDQYIDLGQYSSPLFMNINGDEYPDVLIACQVSEDPGRPLNRVAYFESLGDHEYQLQNLDYGNLSEMLTSGYRPYLTAGDVDGDGDQDLLIGMSNGTSYLVQNDSGTGDRFLIGKAYKDWAELAMINGATPELYDIDQDGDLDVVAGNDAGTINLYRNIGDSQNAQFDSDLDHSPNIKRVGQVTTTDQNSLLGRSSPRIIEIGTDTVLVSGSNKGDVYLYELNFRNLTDPFKQQELKDWPQWMGGNTRLAFDIGLDGSSRLLAGNMAGGLTEQILPATSTNSNATLNQKYQVFPNPVISGQEIKITLKNSPAPVEKIHIVLPNGTYYQTLNNVSENTMVVTKNWTPGVYFIQIILHDKSTFVQKLVVQ